VYFDAQADDARLTLAIARTAAAHGAAVANHARVTGFEKHDGRVVGARVADGDGDRDEEITVRARGVVNASGVWADDVRSLDEGAHPASMQPAKGVHITLPWTRVRNDIAAIVPAPDGERMVFVIPWGDHTYVGTTDTTYDGSLDDPRCTDDDVHYLLDALNGVTEVAATRDDVVGTWAGLRPLLRGGHLRRKTADLSRRHAVRVGPSGLVTVTGGKLTTYRRMAADAVDAVVRQLPGSHPPSSTRRLRLVGAAGIEPSTAALPPPGRSRVVSTTQHLAGRYGSEAPALAALTRERAEWAEPLVPGLAYLKAEAVYAVREEMARTLDDVLSRRTRARILDRRASIAAAPAVAALVAPELEWSAPRRDAEVERYRALAGADEC
jgi:glycerol-3-phosphate dehydrogenase